MSCRNRRRQKAARRPAWVRSYRQAQRHLDCAVRILFSAVRGALDASGQRGKRCPVQTARRLEVLMRKLGIATERFYSARYELAEMKEFLKLAPEDRTGDVPEIVELVVERCEAVAKYLGIATCEVFVAQVDLMEGLATGELVPERPSDRRPRIVTTPRLISYRAVLARRRRPRVADRITPILQRRRRTLRPAEVRVPRRNLLGRAPPLSSTCLL